MEDEKIDSIVTTAIANETYNVFMFGVWVDRTVLPLLEHGEEEHVADVRLPGFPAIGTTFYVHNIGESKTDTVVCMVKEIVVGIREYDTKDHRTQKTLEIHLTKKTI